MSLRKQARILGIAPSYLSMLVNGKRKWPDDLRYRYQELVNSVVNTHKPSLAQVAQTPESLEPYVSYMKAWVCLWTEYIPWVKGGVCLGDTYIYTWIPMTDIGVKEAERYLLSA